MPENKDNLTEFIVFDLETIGLDTVNGKIIEIAGLRVKNWEIIDKYSQLVNPGEKIPRVVSNLTGISDADVKDAPSIDKCLGDFLAFVGDLPLVGHNIVSFDIPFVNHNLQKHKLGSVLKNTAYDTLELSIFLMPQLRKHKLTYLYQELVSQKVTDAHRALADCEMTLEVLKALKKVRDESWDKAWLEHTAGIAKQNKWVWAGFIAQTPDSLTLGKKINGNLPVEQYLDALNWEKFRKLKERAEDIEEADNMEQIQPDSQANVSVQTSEIQKIFAKGKSKKGSLQAVLGANYEYRAQQEKMAERVAESINNNKHLVVEAPTGCGKSLAYLMPAVCWSIKNNNQPVVISTYTNTLQDQLFESDFKLVDQVFSDTKIKITVAKGRDHYVCLRRFKKYIEDVFAVEDNLFSRPERFSAQLFSIFLANWIIKNQDNNADLDRFPYWLRNKVEKFSNSQINSCRETCQGRFCDYYEKCFVNKLKLRTRESNIVVSNHSLVFSDPWHKPSAFSILPNGFKVLVIDEAINIEDAVTNASTESYSRHEFERFVKDFFDPAFPNKGSLRRIYNFLQKSGDITYLKKIKQIQSVARRLLDNNRDLFAIMEKDIGGKKLEYDLRREIFSDFFEEIAVPWQNIAVLLSELMSFFDQINTLFCDNKQNNFCRELRAVFAGFKAYFDLINVLNELDKDRYIFYSVINANGFDASLNVCVKKVGEYLEHHLYNQGLRSVIFASATLTFDQSFDFINKIWGLPKIPKERLDYLRLPYLFDYGEKSALVLVNSLPNRDRGNEAENQKYFYPLLTGFLSNLLVANHGSALLLFTNKRDAGKFGELISEHLEERNIPLYSTERSLNPKIMSGNKSTIIEEFKDSVESCLIGTAGLREGINVPGASLELVVMVKLPFLVPSDPIIKNRQVIYGGFNGYAIPHCLFNIKQAFGRLLRSKDDSGFVFIVDERVMNYGQVIRNNLPDDLRVIELANPDFGRFNKLLAESKGVEGRVLQVVGGIG